MPFVDVAIPFTDTLYRVGANVVKISRLDDCVEILQSLQKPKKVGMICSDGKRRIILCKPKDDLRKDMRSLELMFLVKAAYGKKKFYATIYSAVPLNEEFGVIEWVEGTSSVRSVIGKLYRERGASVNFPNFKELQRAPNFATQFAKTVASEYMPCSCCDTLP